VLTHSGHPTIDATNVGIARKYLQLIVPTA